MKNLLILGLVLSSTGLFASTIVNITALKNPVIEKARLDIVSLQLVTHTTLKKVIVLKGNGKTLKELREKTIAQALHMTCPFFDDGVSVSLDEKSDAGAVNAANTLADNFGEDSDVATLTNALKSVNTQDAEVYSGNASGNNTAGTVLGIYDLKNNELAVFANTNCGSDD